MCNPVAIAMVVAGTALQVNAQNRRQTAMENAADKARLLESTRQEQMTREREAELAKSQMNMGVEGQESELAKAASQREDAYADSNVLPGATDYTPSASAGEPKVVQTENAKRRGEAEAQVNQIGNARARLRSFEDLRLGNQLRNTDAANQIGMLAGFARGSAALLPGEVQAAMNSKAGKYRGQEMLGTALSLYGGAGAPGVGTAAAAGGAGAAGGMGSYGSAVGGSAKAGGTIGGYSGNLSGFVPQAGTAAADAAAPGLFGGLLSNAAGNTGGLLANGGRAFASLAPNLARRRRVS